MNKEKAVEKIATILGENDVLNMSTFKTKNSSSSNNDEIKTIEDFLARTDKVVLNIATYDEFLALAKVMNKLNLKTPSGNDFSNIIDDIWRMFEHLTVMAPDRRFAGGVEAAKYSGYQVIPFKDLDLGKYLSLEELEKLGMKTTYKTHSTELIDNATDDNLQNETLKDKIISDIQDKSSKKELGEQKVNSNNQSKKYEPHYVMTIDEFWEQANNDKPLAIHCNAEWKANILMNVFARMKNISWKHKEDYSGYSPENNKYQFFKMYTCYSDRGFVYDYRQRFDHGRSWFRCISFSDVDLTKYLTKEEIEEIENHKFKYTNPTKLKITLDDFFNNQRFAIACANKEEERILDYIFDYIGKEDQIIWWEGYAYPRNLMICYNRETFGRTSDSYIRYRFQEVDLSKYFTPEFFEITRQKILNDKFYYYFDPNDFIQKETDEDDIDYFGSLYRVR